MGLVNADLKATLDRILAAASDNALMDEMRGSVTYKAPCPKCDDTGWELRTEGKCTTAGGLDVTASVACPVAFRCARGCVPPTNERKKSRATPTNRELTP